MDFQKYHDFLDAELKEANMKDAYQHVRLAGGQKHSCVRHSLGHDVPPNPVHLQ